MLDRKILFGLGLVLLATTYDLSRSYLNSSTNETESTTHSHSDDFHQQASTIPPPKMKNSAIPTIKFAFCSS